MQPQWVPPAGYFDPYFANMQQGLGTQFGQQLESGFMNMQQHFQGQLNTMQQQFQGYVDTGFQTFGQHVHNNMYQPIMTRLENVGTTLQSDMEALNDRFNSLSTSDQFQQLADSQEQLQTEFRDFTTTFSSFSDHFHSYYPAPAPPPPFQPYPPFYPPSLFHPPQDD
jgi:hypothetical protein